MVVEQFSILIQRQVTPLYPKDAKISQIYPSTNSILPYNIYAWHTLSTGFCVHPLARYPGSKMAAIKPRMINACQR